MTPAGPLPEAPDTLILHASAVAVDGAGILITGVSGAGKSELALQLLSLGARLIADDRTVVHVRASGLRAACPEAIRGMIEARGVGILNAEPAGEVPVRLVVDLDQTETRRLPERHDAEIAGHKVRCFHKSASRAFPAAIMQYLRSGLREPE
ncbi:HPr kinase/phosphatase C-terminal domain-containing protein [Roseobacter sp.]|uniref:HPr kinase/phosphorylase n=1 Tax=Roseobacter sp. TaxID=1907202 RepID=UPI0025F40BFE|nr:HPr kinase/phosphatase C-terminal domain-containing protein [Roseobacter sp.]